MKGLCLALVAAFAAQGFARLGAVRFVVLDPISAEPIDAVVTVSTPNGYAKLSTSKMGRETRSVDLEALAFTDSKERIVYLIPDRPIVLQDQSQRPVKEFVIVVTAKRRTAPKPTAGANSVELSHDKIEKFTKSNSGDVKDLTKGQKGVAEDSAGQQHVRGEHADISYVVDGVPLPDTVAGHQGSVVVPSTIDSLEMVTGGFAPEFGGQVAAVLNITTNPGAARAKRDFSQTVGSYGSTSSDLTLSGPLGPSGSYVLNGTYARTKLAQEPLQPGGQDLHNGSYNASAFAKFRYRLSQSDVLTLTLNRAPGTLQVANRQGLPFSYAAYGQGYGFGGLRNADGSRPDVNDANRNALGAAPLSLQSQQALGMDIDERDINEFATLNWQKSFSKNLNGQIAVTLLHSGQEISNSNPAVDLGNLPVDSSIEYNPNVTRNVHHIQANGSLTKASGAHKFKAGFLIDNQTGRESYQITPASQLALDALAALSPSLAPTGSAGQTLDVNGNPVYTPTGAVPTLALNRKATYQAAYIQDSYTLGRFASNVGLRWDGYVQSQDLTGLRDRSALLSPRLNFSYKLSGRDTLRWSYNRLFNTPPLAQGAQIGQAIAPETLHQYDLALERKVGKGQSVGLGYYYKDIRNQVDTGLLIPGSQIGVYSSVNFQRGAVHGIEASYDLSAPRGYDAYLNFSFSVAKPEGVDNTGAPVPLYNDHDQRRTLGVGLARTLANGVSGSLTLQYGSGLASSVVDKAIGRTPRTLVDAKLSSGEKLFNGRGSLNLDIQNLFDVRKVINFQSAFSGTRFTQGRRVSLSANLKF